MPSNFRDCDECNGSRRVWDDDQGEYVTCQCVIQQRLKTYLEPLGSIKKPPQDIIDTLDAVDDPLQDLWINVQNYDEKIFTGIIAYLLKAIFPTDYATNNICAMHSRFRDEHTFSELFDIDDPLFILTAGLDEEFEGWDENREEIRSSYANTARQLIGRRYRFGQPTWVVERDAGLRKAHDFLVDKNFKQIKICKNRDNQINNGCNAKESDGVDAV